ncbi:MAG: protein translocase subunit SecF [Candidatus Eisenbacteria bacterium]|uniref:Protein-export membrane protein SecF n=1 Tax=Eiseniibacteriota bacterium TaxID=2212470 RepID=A0A956N8Y1_UNCEI|nr:protein translocase subunit SecF [Candidatus Eisenbacteria bacterium]MCB9462250.1 protein translocase subunit SecF [Candidatus Eisenbacteria bacterium]
MFQILHETHIPFLAIRKRAYVLSIALCVIGLASLTLHKGLRLGVDFAGGRLFEYRFSETMEAEELRDILTQIGATGGEVQEMGSEGHDFIVRIPVSDEEAAADEAGPSRLFVEKVKEMHPGVTAELRKEELVGPRVGQELRGKAIKAIVISLVLILLYVGVRFEFKFALGGVVALAHDVLITVFVLSLLDVEFTIPIVAALLTIGGYSINDTVIVFDRIREQSRQLIGHRLSEVMDISLNQVLSRTIITSLTTFLAAGALYLLGGEVIHDFALTMLIGIIIGTYSSIYVASALALEIARNPIIASSES